MMDYREIGGTQFLGIKKPVIKAHGSSNAKAFKNAVRQCVLFTEADIIASLRLVIDLAGDGGCSPWRDGEYEACIEYLDELKSRLESKYSVECCECDTISDIDNA